MVKTKATLILKLAVFSFESAKVSKKKTTASFKIKAAFVLTNEIVFIEKNEWIKQFDFICKKVVKIQLYSDLNQEFELINILVPMCQDLSLLYYYVAWCLIRSVSRPINLNPRSDVKKYTTLNWKKNKI